jgi:GNAT superfamily N-acetyltransferase
VREHETGIRPWQVLTDLTRLAEVSRAADELYAAHGIELPPDEPATELLDARHVLVADAPHPIGFAIINELDELAHLGQLAVHPVHNRHGVGSALLTAVCAWAQENGYPAITLTTFAEVPWNAPWYTARGFVRYPDDEWGPELRKQWQIEEDAGLMVAPRIAMVRKLGAGH